MADRHDFSGKLITSDEAVKLAAATAQASACFTLYNGPSLKWQINITFNPNSYPFVITGGTITGNICGSPKGVVTGGSFGPTLTIQGDLNGGPTCANTVTIVGHFEEPAGYAGTYGFNGSSNQFPHTTLYCCGPCS